jgi:drug/metabolite transporter (DMT)-like permease
MPPVPSKRRPMTAPARGAAWMIAAATAFSLMTWSIRELAPIAASEVIFLRSLVGLFLVLPWLRLPEGRLVRRPRIGIFCLRACLSYAAMLAWFYAIQHVVLADGVALQFTLPLFTILFAIIVFKEPVGVRRWTATVIGFAGALIIIRPGFAEIDAATVLVIVSAALYGAANMAVRYLSRREQAQTLVFYLHALTLPLALAGAIPYWIWPGWADVPWIIVLGVTGTLAHYCFARSMAIADASVVMPFDYLRLPMLAAVGYFAYSEQATVWTWVGAAIICSSTFYIVHRESQIARAAEDGKT